jgi:hypothetical protein
MAGLKLTCFDAGGVLGEGLLGGMAGDGRGAGQGWDALPGLATKRLPPINVSFFSMAYRVDIFLVSTFP